MLSQNRQVEKDKVKSTLNYEVSLKIHCKGMRLHQKFDAFSENRKEDKTQFGVS